MTQSRHTKSASASFRAHLAVILAFASLAIAATYPLILHFTTAIAGRASDHEEAAFAWNLWWTRHALLDLQQSPFFTDYIFYPFTVDLRLHTFAPLYGVLSIPFQFILDVGGALNSLVLLTITLNGYTTYLLARHVVSRDRPALIAGTLVALGPALTFHLRAGKPSFASVWTVALSLLFITRLAAHYRWRDAAGLGLALLAALLLDFQILMYTGLWVALYGGYLIIRRSDLVLNKRFVAGALLALGLVAIPFWLVFYHVLVSAAASGYPVPTARDTLDYSLYATLFVTPWFVRSTFGGILPMFILSTLAVLHRTWQGKFWLAGGLVFLVLSLGIVLQPTALPLPFAALRTLPGMAQFRTPYRFTIPATLGLAVAAAGGWAYWQDRLVPARWRSAATLVLIGLVLIDSRSIAPFALQRYPDVDVYSRLAGRPGDFTILEVPVGVRSGTDVFGAGDFLQFYQTIHGKPMINGMVARVPRRVFDYYRSSPSLRLLAGESVAVEPSVRREFADRLNELDVGYVIVHPGMLEPVALARVEALLAGEPTLTRTEATPGVWVYAVFSTKCGISKDEGWRLRNHRPHCHTAVGRLCRGGPVDVSRRTAARPFTPFYPHHGTACHARSPPSPRDGTSRPRHRWRYNRRQHRW